LPFFSPPLTLFFQSFFPVLFQSILLASTGIPFLWFYGTLTPFRLRRVPPLFEHHSSDSTTFLLFPSRRSLRSRFSTSLRGYPHSRARPAPPENTSLPLLVPPQSPPGLPVFLAIRKLPPGAGRQLPPLDIPISPRPFSWLSPPHPLNGISRRFLCFSGRAEAFSSIVLRHRPPPLVFHRVVSTGCFVFFPLNTPPCQSRMIGKNFFSFPISLIQLPFSTLPAAVIRGDPVPTSP